MKNVRVFGVTRKLITKNMLFKYYSVYPCGQIYQSECEEQYVLNE